jgi:hypothetical protein
MSQERIEAGFTLIKQLLAGTAKELSGQGASASNGAGQSLSYMAEKFSTLQDMAGHMDANSFRSYVSNPGQLESLGFPKNTANALRENVEGIFDGRITDVNSVLHGFNSGIKADMDASLGGHAAAKDIKPFNHAGGPVVAGNGGHIPPTGNGAGFKSDFSELPAASPSKSFNNKGHKTTLVALGLAALLAAGYGVYHYFKGDAASSSDDKTSAQQTTATFKDKEHGVFWSLVQAQTTTSVERGKMRESLALDEDSSGHPTGRSVEQLAIANALRVNRFALANGADSTGNLTEKDLPDLLRNASEAKAADGQYYGTMLKDISLNPQQKEPKEGDRVADILITPNGMAVRVGKFGDDHRSNWWAVEFGHDAKAQLAKTPEAKKAHVDDATVRMNHLLHPVPPFEASSAKTFVSGAMKRLFPNATVWERSPFRQVFEDRAQYAEFYNTINGKQAEIAKDFAADGTARFEVPLTDKRTGATSTGIFTLETEKFGISLVQNTDLEDKTAGTQPRLDMETEVKDRMALKPATAATEVKPEEKKAPAVKPVLPNTGKGLSI